jgi:hypothetical protein
VISGYLGAIGQVGCGCLGVIQINPWYVFGMDIAILVMLPFARPNLRSLFRGRDWNLKTVALPVMFPLALILIAFGSARAVFGSIEGGVSWLRGEPLALSTRHVDFGEVDQGEQYAASVTLRNRSDHAVRVLGATQTGFLSVTSKLPFGVQPGETCYLTINLRTPRGKTGILTNGVELLTDDAAQQRVPLQVSCRVR